MRVVAVVQARCSSSRFPDKVLADLQGKPMVQHVYDRLRECAQVDAVVVATSDDPSDDELERMLSAASIPVFRGSLHDVLGRFVAAVSAAEADVAVRITADCPLLDPDVVDAMVRRFRKGDLDYLSNVSPPSFPDGLDCEIVTLKALQTADAEATDSHAREHVTGYIRARPGLFTAENHAHLGLDRSAWQWSVDTPKDLALVTEIMAAAGTGARLRELLQLMARRPELAARSAEGRVNTGGARTFVESLHRGPRPTITRSDALWKRAAAVIPTGTQTLSKGPTQFVRGFAPKFLVRGEGCRVWDADGNEFVDYPMALGPVTLGHAHPRVIEAVTRQLQDGSAFSLMHPLEVELAERIVEWVPCAEQVRFGKNGSDATSACIRAARALTGRRHIARCGYHGWQDWSIDTSYGIRSRGVPKEVMELTRPFVFNDLASLERVLEQDPCAAVILEPVGASVPDPGFLEGVREAADRYGAILIFDEVITGFRWARGGAQEYFGVEPDLVAMGKGVANGLPLAVVAGKAEAMRAFEEIFFSFTFGGEVAALAAAWATLDVMQEQDYWSHAWRLGERLSSGFKEHAALHRLEQVASCVGMPPWTIIGFADTGPWSALQLKSLFQQEMIRRGILFSGSQFISLAHTDEVIERTISAYDESLAVLRSAIDLGAVSDALQGEVNEAVFRKP